jgi:hypothetical protein
MLGHPNEIQPARAGKFLKVPEKDQAINYAQNRASFRSGEIR